MLLKDILGLLHKLSLTICRYSQSVQQIYSCHFQCTHNFAYTLNVFPSSLPLSLSLTHRPTHLWIFTHPGVYFHRLFTRYPVQMASQVHKPYVHIQNPKEFNIEHVNEFLSITNRSYLTEEQHSYSMWNSSAPDQPLTDGFPAEFCKHLGSWLSFVFSRVALKLYFQSSSNNENIALNSS